MKRNVLTVVLSVTMLFGLTACGKTASLDEIEGHLQVLFYSDQENRTGDNGNSEEYDDYYTDFQDEYYNEEYEGYHGAEPEVTVDQETIDAYIQENYPLGLDTYCLLNEFMDNHIKFENYFAGQYMYISNGIVTSVTENYVQIRLPDEEYYGIYIDCYTDPETIMEAKEGASASVTGYVGSAYNTSFNLDDCSIEFYY